MNHHHLNLRSGIADWTARLAIAATWGYAFGTMIEVMQGLTPGAAVWVLTIFATAAGIAWILTRPRKNRPHQSPAERRKAYK